MFKYNFSNFVLRLLISMINYNSITSITYECVCKGSSETEEAIKGQCQIYKLYFFTENK